MSLGEQIFGIKYKHNNKQFLETCDAYSPYIKYHCFFPQDTILCFFLPSFHSHFGNSPLNNIIQILSTYKLQGT